MLVRFGNYLYLCAEIKLNPLIQSIMQKQNDKKKGESKMEGRYINPYTDFGFKKLFGTEMNKDLLISFLNALFNGKKQEITDVQYLNSERLGDGYGDRRAVFDVYCQTSDGSHFIVEMQKAEQEYFTNNEYPADSYRHEIKLKDVEDNHVFYDKLTFVYLEMPKFTKTEEELETMFDKWMFVLHNLGVLLDRPKALQDRVFKKLFEQAEIASYNEAERRQYFESQKEYWDYYSTMKTALKKGLAQGEAKANRENARRMKADGMALDLISKYTNLTIEEIEAL